MTKNQKNVLLILLLLTILIPTKILALEYESIGTKEELTKALSKDANIIITDNILNIDETILIDKNVTIDLNGKTISFAEGEQFLVKGGNLNLTGKGIVKEEVPYFGAVLIKGSDKKEDINYSKVTIGKDVTLEGWSPIFIDQLNGPNKVKDSYGIIVNIYGTLISVADSSGNNGAGIYVNGNIKHKENYPIINIYDSASITTDGEGIYAAGYAQWNIEGATINGGVGIGTKAGIFNLKNVTINATDKYENPKYWGNGIYSTAAVIQIESNNGYAGDIDITIDGGTYTSAYGYAIQHYLASEKGENVNNNLKNLVIKNGTFISGKDLAIESVLNDKITIVGGIYSSSVSKYISDEYTESLVDNKYVVAKKEVKIDTPTIDTTKPVEEVTIGVKEDETLKETLVKAIEDSKIDVKDINAVVMITIANQKEEELSIETVKNIKETLIENENIKVVSFFDITLNVKNNITGESLGTLNTLDNKVKFNMVLPEELTKIEEDYTRKYYVLRYHDGKTDIIPSTVEGNILTFESDKFSTYALAYEDTKKETITTPPIEDNNKEEITNPRTIDNVVLNLVVGFISVTGLVLISKSIAKRKKYFN